MPAIPKPRPSPKSPRRALKRSGRIKPKKRTAGEFARIYHSRARVLFVKQLGCVVCGQGPCDNAHIESGGMGRKADYTKIVPLCCMPADDPSSPGYYRGHHGYFHQVGRAEFEKGYRWAPTELDHLAAATEAAWQAFSKEGE